MPRDHKYTPIKLGWIYSSEMKRPGHINKEIAGPNYREINDINRAGPYLISIEEDRALINGIVIARAPGNFTATKKARFLKSVCWALLNDPGALTDKINEYAIPDRIEAPGPDIGPAIKDPEEIPGPVPLTPGLSPLGPIRAGWLHWARCLIEEIPGPGVMPCQ
jgi:hypothetical protein